jgi:anaerobic magnesium-protoporphyrin IX monomethyl ester cyclase
MRLLLFSNIKGPDLYLPLNLLALASYAGLHGHEATVIDGQTTVDWREKGLLLAQDVDLLLVSSYTGPSIAAPATLIKSLRESGWDRPVAWGGYHATLAGTSILRDGFADYTVTGPGEYALGGLLEHLAGERDLATVPSISYRDGDEVRTTRTQTIRNLDGLPPIDYGYVDVSDYFTEDRRIVQYVSSYGCPYACTFCAEPTHSLRRWNGMSPERMLADIHRIAERYAPERISFVDPNFSSQPSRVAELAKLLATSGAPMGLNCNMRARDVLMLRKLISLDLLREAGFRRIFVGVESGSDQTLKLLKKASTANQHVEAILALDAAGIEVQASFIHDLPGESMADAAETLDVAEQLIGVKTADSVQSHHFYMPYPGTELGQEAGFDLASVPTEAWAQSSTFRANAIWCGNSDRRAWVIERLARLHEKNPRVITDKEVGRLTSSARVEHDYVDRFML